MAEETVNEDMMRRLLVNQRAIMEQNQKILQQQQKIMDEERERGNISRHKVPLILKVSNNICFFMLVIFNIHTTTDESRALFIE